MIDERTALAFASEWVAAFNSGKLDRILSHYAQEVTLISPLHAEFSGGSDTVRGIDALRDYFAAALARFPRLHFTLLEVGTGSRGLCIRYRTSIGDRIALETFRLDQDRRAIEVLCHYVG